MTGLAARGLSIRVVRTGLEVTVLAIGWLLGGTVGVGTVLYAVSIGPLAHVFVPFFSRGRVVATPVLEVVRVAGKDAITDSIGRFGKITQLRFKLIEPNDETDAAEAVSALESSLRPTEPTRLEVVVSGPKGLNKAEVERAVGEVSEGQNTEIVVDGEDKEGLKMKADNNEFALSLPIEDAPKEDPELADALFKEYEKLAGEAKVKGLNAIDKVKQKVRQLVQRI